MISGGKAGLVGVLANGTVSFASFFGTVVVVGRGAGGEERSEQKREQKTGR